MPAGIPLPAGIEQLPDLGPDVVGTRPRQVWAIMVWFSVVLMLGLTVLFVFVALGPRASGAGPWIGVLICVAVTAALAWFATTIGKPILIIRLRGRPNPGADRQGGDPVALHHRPQHGSGRSFVAARRRRRRPGRRQAGQEEVDHHQHIRTYRVAPGDLMNYIAARARASHQG